MEEHELFMGRCLDLARLGAGQVSPNPMVGALLVYQGEVVAENYHQKYGGPHAEAFVIQQVLERYGEAKATEIFQNSTLYVSLEPCSHQGKTPPCADLIVAHGIPRVIVGMLDPSDKVNGKGIVRMREAGIDVIEGVMEEEAQWLNRRFTTRIRQNRPYIILKWAQTNNGFMAPIAQEKKWITGPEARQLVHRWRSEEDAVLVGCGTALADDPQLDVREWKGRNPLRILIDKELVVPPTAALYNDAAPTIVFNMSKSHWEDKLKLIPLENFDLYLPQQIAYQLYLLDVQSLVVEGGVKTLETFIRAGLWDEVRILQSGTNWGEGRPAPRIENAVMRESYRVGKDHLTVFTQKDGTLFAG